MIVVLSINIYSDEKIKIHPRPEAPHQLHQKIAKVAHIQAEVIVLAGEQPLNQILLFPSGYIPQQPGRS